MDPEAPDPSTNVPPGRISVFIVYGNPNDYLLEIYTYLRSHRIFHVDYDTRVPGRSTHDIPPLLESCDAAVLLVNEHFFISDYVQSTEIPIICRRYHQDNVILVSAACTSIVHHVEHTHYLVGPNNTPMASFPWIPEHGHPRRYQAVPLDLLYTSGERNLRYQEIIKMILAVHDRRGNIPSIEPDPPGGPPTRGFADALRRATARLLDWPRTIAGKWIPRVECSEIREKIQTQKNSVTVLLGGPGSGKSAILSQLAAELQDQHHVLGIKADQLSVAVTNRDSLAAELELPSDPVAMLRALAVEKTCILLVDQLDALANLVDKNAHRLEVLLDIIADLRSTPNIHIIASCRTFDYEHDPRLAGLAEPLMLQPIAWSDVRTILESQGIPAAPLESASSILTIPSNLRFFLRAAEQTPGEIPNGRDFVIAKLVGGLSHQTRAVARLIAREMASAEQFFVNPSTVHHELAAAGLLEKREGRYTFAHQTIYEFFLSEAIVEDGLDGFIKLMGDSTSARRRFRSLVETLHQTRSIDEFHHQLELAWQAPLPGHFRHLLIEFVANRETPAPADVEWIRARLREPDWLESTLRCLAGPAWLPALQPEIETLMARPEAESLFRLLATVAPLRPQDVVDLLRRHWLNPERIAIAQALARSLPITTAVSRQLWMDIVSLPYHDHDRVLGYVHDNGKHPELTVEILTRHLSTRINTALEGLPASLTSNDLERILRYDWDDYDKTHMLAPAAFIQGIWQTVNRVLLRSDQPNRMLGIFDLEVEIHSPYSGSNTLVDLIREALHRGGKDQGYFPSIMRLWQREQPTAVVLRVLILDLLISVDRGPDAIALLLEQPDLLFVCDWLSSDPWTSRDQLEKLVEIVGIAELEQLQDALLSHAIPEGDDPERAQMFDTWHDEHKRGLLEVIPKYAHTAETIAWIIQFDARSSEPRWDRERPSYPQTEFIESPLSEQLLSSLPAEVRGPTIAALDVKITSGPYAWGRGVELDRETAKVLASRPHEIETTLKKIRARARAEGILGTTLLVWAQQGERDLVVQWTRWAIAQSYGSARFRNEATMALDRFVDEELAWEFSDQLQAWLTDDWEDIDYDMDEHSLSERDLGRPVIGHGRGGYLVPQGRAGVLRVLLRCLIHRGTDSELARIVGLVHEHWMIISNRANMPAFIYSIFRYIVRKDIFKTALLTELALDSRGILAEDCIILLSWLHDDDPMFLRVLHGVRDGSWLRGRQAYAEIVVHCTLDTTDRWPVDAIEEILTSRDPDLLAGLLHAACLDKRAARGLDWFVEVAPIIPEELYQVWLQPLIARSLPREQALPLGPLLQPLVARPPLIRHAGMDLLHYCYHMVTHAPAQVAFVVGEIFRDMRERRKQPILARETVEHLVGILAVLQRKSKLRGAAFAILDDLMNMNAYGYPEVITKLERGHE